MSWRKSPSRLAENHLFPFRDSWQEFGALHSSRMLLPQEISAQHAVSLDLKLLKSVCTPVCLCAVHMPGAGRGQKRERTLEVEVQMEVHWQPKLGPRGEGRVPVL